MYKSVCVVFIFKTKNTDAAFQPPHPHSSSTGRLMLRNQPSAVFTGKYLLEKSEFRMEKVSEKQDSSAVDISIPMMAAFFRHCTRAAAGAADRTPHKHSTVTVQFLVCRAVDLNLHYRWRAQHHEWSWSQFDAYKAGNSTDRTSQHSTGQMICKGLSSENKSKVRLLPTEHCSWNNQARSQMHWRQLVLWVRWWISWWHKHHKQEELPTSFTDRFGTDQKTSKKEVIAPLPSPRESCAWKTRMVTLKTSIWSSQKRL